MDVGNGPEDDLTVLELSRALAQMEDKLRTLSLRSLPGSYSDLETTLGECRKALRRPSATPRDTPMQFVYHQIRRDQASGDEDNVLFEDDLHININLEQPTQPQMNIDGVISLIYELKDTIDAECIASSGDTLDKFEQIDLETDRMMAARNLVPCVYDLRFFEGEYTTASAIDRRRRIDASSMSVIDIFNRYYTYKDNNWYIDDEVGDYNDFPTFFMQSNSGGETAGFRIDYDLNMWTIMLVERNCPLYASSSRGQTVNMGIAGKIITESGWTICWRVVNKKVEVSEITHVEYPRKLVYSF